MEKNTGPTSLTVPLLNCHSSLILKDPVEVEKTITQRQQVLEMHKWEDTPSSMSRSEI